jgi:hypothetical protein
VWFIFSRFGVQTSARIETNMSRGNVSRELSGESPSTQFHLCRDSVVKQVAKSLPQLEFLACDAVYVLGRTGVSFGEICCLHIQD